MIFPRIYCSKETHNYETLNSPSVTVKHSSPHNKGEIGNNWRNPKSQVWWQIFRVSVRFRLVSGPRFGHFWWTLFFCVLPFSYVFVSNNFINSQHTLIRTHTHTHTRTHVHSHAHPSLGLVWAQIPKYFASRYFWVFLFKKQVLAEFFVDGY